MDNWVTITFKLQELLNDMKMLAMFAGELVISIKYAPPLLMFAKIMHLTCKHLLVWGQSTNGSHRNISKGSMLLERWNPIKKLRKNNNYLAKLNGLKSQHLLSGKKASKNSCPFWTNTLTRHMLSLGNIFLSVF